MVVSHDQPEALFPPEDAELVPVSRAVQQQRVFQVLRYVHEHLSESLDLATLERVGHLSPTHLVRVFRGLTGESVYQHVKRVRLERAAVCLRVTQASVKEVSLACGFDSHEAFTRAFSQAFGCSPRSFRQKARPETDLPSPLPLHYREEGPPSDFIPLPDLTSTLDVKVIERPPMRVAYVRHVGAYAGAHQTWAKLLWWAWRRSRLHQRAQFFGINYDDADVTPEHLQRYDAAIVVEDNFQGDGAILAQTIDGGLFARTTVVGTFEEYEQAWDTFFFQWLPQSRYALRAWYGLDRYVPPPHWSGGPTGLIAAALRQLHVEIHMPVVSGPCEQSLLS